MPEQHILLLTATVDVGGTPRLEIREPYVREQQYARALERWCEELPAHWRIALVENSAWPADRFQRIACQAGRDLIFVSCENSDLQGGKGVGEATSIDSFLASQTDAGVHWIFKCTGRLFVPNFTRCMPRLDRQDGVCALVTPNLHYVDSRLFGAQASLFQRYFTSMAAEISEDEGTYFEHIAAKRMLLAVGGGNAFLPFAALPRFEGLSGTKGTSYRTSRTVARRILHEQFRRLMFKTQMTI